MFKSAEVQFVNIRHRVRHTPSIAHFGEGIKSSQSSAVNTEQLIDERFWQLISQIIVGRSVFLIDKFVHNGVTDKSLLDTNMICVSEILYHV